VLSARESPPLGDGYGLLQPPGAQLSGFDGKPILVPTVDRLAGASIISVNLKGWAGPAVWPYTPSDFAREDEGDDLNRYAEPNLVPHLDHAARNALAATYDALFKSKGRATESKDEPPAMSHQRPLALLDVGGSWLSHYPRGLPNGTRVAVHGLNREELSANEEATETCVADLNRDPRLPYADASFDFVTSASAVQYLTRPLEVFAEIHRVLAPGGVAIVAFSNRCFAKKATQLWLRHMDEEVALCSVVLHYFHFSPPGGWANISSADVSPHPSSGDPLWLVTAVKR